MTPMKIKTRFYFNDGDTLEAASPFEELCKNVKGITNSNCFLVLDQSGREHLIRWSSVKYAENCYNQFDKLMEHQGEKSEVGVAADFVAKFPYGWGLPNTDYTKAVWDWLKMRQELIPKEFQALYIKIADTLLKEWGAENVSGKVDFLREKASDLMNLDDMEENTEHIPDDFYKLYEFLRSKMPLIERERHEKEDKR